MLSMLNKMRPLSTRRNISSAAILIIGDEVLNGKIKDTNSQFFAQYCFELGINLRRICVVPDETEDIVDTLNFLRSKYDFIATTGGIGPTHDDITYESIAKAYGLPLSLNQATVDKMNKFARNPPNKKTPGSPELDAQLRMARFPTGEIVKPIFVSPELWVPVVALNEQVFIFPGIPSLYRQMLEGLRELIASKVDAPKLSRRYVSTLTPESTMAPILSDIQQTYGQQGVKIGSYPHYNDQRNTISILGPDSAVLARIVDEVIPKVEAGKEVSPEDEARSS